MNRYKNTWNSRGVTMTELLVVLLIISLLATIAVPVYLNKVEQAKIVIAKQELRELAHAEDACALKHGYYVPLQMLDDLIYDRNVSRSSGIDSTDDLYNEYQFLYLIDPLRDINDQRGNQVQLSSRNLGTPFGSRVESMYNYWTGPFLNPHRVLYAEEIKRDDDNIPSDAYRLDYPLDPWGQPYRFYCPIGLIGSMAYSNDPDDWRNNNFSDGQITTNDDRVDRYAIVSYGPDTTTALIPGGLIETETDDIEYLFGGLFNESSFRIFY